MCNWAPSDVKGKLNAAGGGSLIDCIDWSVDDELGLDKLGKPEFVSTKCNSKTKSMPGKRNAIVLLV